jgi:hypothetical protein
MSDYIPLPSEIAGILEQHEISNKEIFALHDA